MATGPWLTGLALAVAALAATPAAAQDSRTIELARELTGLLDRAKLDSIATRRAESTDMFVAALYFPGQLLVVSSKYAVPALLNEKIARQLYRDAYIDLNVAVDPTTKFFIEDMGADGLRARREENSPFDIYSKGDARFPFDGDWKKRKVSEEVYQATFKEAETNYTQMLEALIAEIAAATPAGIDTFLLTCNPDVDAIAGQQRRTRVTTIQICDDLAPGAHQRLRAAVPGVTLVQVVHVDGQGAVARAVTIGPQVDAILLDSGNQKLAVKELGGTGRRHDWSISRRIRDAVPVPVYLAGGLRADNVAALRIAERLGYTEFARGHEAVYRNGAYVDEVSLLMQRATWDERWAKSEREYVPFGAAR